MQTRFVFAASALVFALTCAAQAHAAEPSPLRWDCTRDGAPSLRETAATYGLDNYTRVVPARDALYRQIRRACTRGVDRVVVVEPTATAAQSRVASR